MSKRCGCCGDLSNRAALMADRLCEECYEQRELANAGWDDYCRLLAEEDNR